MERIICIYGEIYHVSQFLSSFADFTHRTGIKISILKDIKNHVYYKLTLVLYKYAVNVINVPNAMYIVTDAIVERKTANIFNWNLKDKKNCDLNDLTGAMTAYLIMKSGPDGLIKSPLVSNLKITQVFKYFGMEHLSLLPWSLAPNNSSFKALFNSYFSKCLNGEFNHDLHYIYKYFNEILRYDYPMLGITNFCIINRKKIIRSANLRLMSLCPVEFPITGIYKAIPDKITFEEMCYLADLDCLLMPTKRKKLGHFCKLCTNKYCDICYEKKIKETGAGFIIKSQNYSYEQNLELILKIKLTLHEIKILFPEIHSTFNLILQN
jgi:hypothetical protein